MRIEARRYRVASQFVMVFYLSQCDLLRLKHPTPTVPLPLSTTVAWVLVGLHIFVGDRPPR